MVESSGLDAAPAITLLNPTNSAVLYTEGPIPYYTQADVLFTAELSPPMAAVREVDFYAFSWLEGKTAWLGGVTNAPYEITNELHPGDYLITAQVVDTAGVTNISNAAEISIIGSTLPPARRLRRETTVSTGWIAEQLAMGSVSNVTFCLAAKR